MNGAELTSLDFVLLAVLAVSTLVGIIRGLIRELLSLLAWVVALWLSIQYAPLVAVHLDAYLNSKELQYAVAVAAIFVVSLLCLSLLAMLATKLLNLAGIAGTDRSLGAIFGLLRGIAIILLAVFVLRLTPAAKQPWFLGSLLVPYLDPVYSYIDERDFINPLDSTMNESTNPTLNQAPEQN